MIAVLKIVDCRLLRPVSRSDCEAGESGSVKGNAAGHRMTCTPLLLACCERSAHYCRISLPKLSVNCLGQEIDNTNPPDHRCCFDMQHLSKDDSFPVHIRNGRWEQYACIVLLLLGNGNRRGCCPMAEEQLLGGYENHKSSGLCFRQRHRSCESL